MSNDAFQIVVLNDKNKKYLNGTRNIFKEYAKSRNYDAALGDYTKEIAELLKVYSAPDGLLLIAKKDEEVGACIAYRAITPAVCEMKRLFVLPEFRNCGLGTSLVRELLTKATEAGFVEMKLDTHPSMKKAKKLYREFGFKPCSPYNNNPTPGIKHLDISLIDMR